MFGLRGGPKSMPQMIAQVGVQRNGGRFGADKQDGAEGKKLDEDFLRVGAPRQIAQAGNGNGRPSAREKRQGVRASTYVSTAQLESAMERADRRAHQAGSDQQKVCDRLCRGAGIHQQGDKRASNSC